MVASVEHLLLWANIVVPLQQFDGIIVHNPPRPYSTLARGALESAAQAVWVLEQQPLSGRDHRHLRLLHHDLRQRELVLRAKDDDRQRQAREWLQKIGERTDGTYSFGSIKDEPRPSVGCGWER